VKVSHKNGVGGDSTTDPADGRRRRSAQSREAIVSAMFDLIGEGDLRPSAQRVADRAGVGIRTVFRHFDEMDRLFAEMNARLLATIRPLLAAGRPSGTVGKRARDLAARRCDVYERLGPYKRSANLQRLHSAYLRKTHREMVRDLRADLERWLPEVSRAPSRVANAIEAAVSFEVWDRLRSDQQLSQRDAREAMEAMLDAFVATALRHPA